MITLTEDTQHALHILTADFIEVLLKAAGTENAKHVMSEHGFSAEDLSGARCRFTREDIIAVYDWSEETTEEALLELRVNVGNWPSVYRFWDSKGAE